MTASADLLSVSPALQFYTDSILFGEVWKRPGLSTRDRSLITVAARIARNQTVDLAADVSVALDNGVTPCEMSEIIFHLAFYAGWPNAMAAVPAVKSVFTQRHIDAGQLPGVAPTLLPIDSAMEAARAARVEQDVGPVSAALVDYTGSLLFNDLWLRPDLGPRDRSLVTMSALIAAGQVAQIPFHLNRAMDNGLTKAQGAEALTHLAFYVGWPNAMSAVQAIKGVFESRPAP